LLTLFLSSRRQGLSPRTIEFYECYLDLSCSVVGIEVTGQEIRQFLENLNCSNGGKHAYYRVLRAFYNWLYSKKSDLGLNPQDNPILLVDPPKVERRILPSLNKEQLEYLVEQAECVRDKAIISLFADSGLRLSELAFINPTEIDWNSRLIKVKVKGNKEGLAAFGERTKSLLKQWLAQYHPNGTLWDIDDDGIRTMLVRLKEKTGLPCNPHTFRRTFASILAKRGVDSLHIMRLGRWESIAMVEIYTRSVQFEDSLKLYSPVVE
jgi:integrase/recombinase XerC